jgi:hypothetical protein
MTGAGNTLLEGGWPHTLESFAFETARSGRPIYGSTANTVFRKAKFPGSAIRAGV